MNHLRDPHDTRHKRTRPRQQDPDADDKILFGFPVSYLAQITETSGYQGGSDRGLLFHGVCLALSKMRHLDASTPSAACDNDEMRSPVSPPARSRQLPKNSSTPKVSANARKLEARAKDNGTPSMSGKVYQAGTHSAL